ncbi:hypothetical protein Droror1_Dr00024454 [Drosera rotundifolia]
MTSVSSCASMEIAHLRSSSAMYELRNGKDRDVRTWAPCMTILRRAKFSFDMASGFMVSSVPPSSKSLLQCWCRRTPSWRHHHVAGEVVNQIQSATGSDELRLQTRILEVNPNPRNGLASMVIDWMEKIMIKLLYRPPSEPNPFLSGNFAPVADEAPLTENLTIHGCLPDCLNGEFMGVGSNPKFTPVAGYHWFDGDGMVHALRFKDGKASYVSRFVRTSRLKQEEFFGGSKFGKIGDLKGLLGLASVCRGILREKLNLLDITFGNGQANTALVYHGGVLLALQETDKPYVLNVLRNGDVETLGILDYDGKLSQPFTAHPKVDPFTGEMFGFSCGFTPPFLTYVSVSKEGIMHDPVDISIPEPVLMHDFAITENYAIIMDLPLCFRPKDMLTENTLVYTFDPMKKSRFGILPRYAKNDLSVKWFELPSCFIFHNANAWEDGKELILITSRIETPYLDLTSGAMKEKPENNHPELYEMRFNTETGLASQRKLSAPAVEFPHINQQYTGRKSYVNVIDAKTMSADPFAAVELPCRVPYLFHTCFLTEVQLREQAV